MTFVERRRRAGTLKRWLDSLTEAHDRRHDAPALKTWRKLRLVNRWFQ